MRERDPFAIWVARSVVPLSLFWVTTQILGKHAENCSKTLKKCHLAKKFPRKSRGNPAGFFLFSLTFPLFNGHLDQNVLKTRGRLKMFDLIFKKGA